MIFRSYVTGASLGHVYPLVRTDHQAIIGVIDIDEGWKVSDDSRPVVCLAIKIVVLEFVDFPIP